VELKLRLDQIKMEGTREKRISCDITRECVPTSVAESKLLYTNKAGTNSWLRLCGFIKKSRHQALYSSPSRTVIITQDSSVSLGEQPKASLGEQQVH
jgi:hypothetical protein